MTKTGTAVTLYLPYLIEDMQYIDDHEILDAVQKLISQPYSKLVNDGFELECDEFEFEDGKTP